MKEQLLVSLCNACEFFRITAVYDQIIQCYARDQLDCAIKYQTLKERKKSPLFANILSILFGSFFLIANIEVGSVILILLGLLLSVAFPVFHTAYCKSVTKKYQKEADDFWNREGGYIYAEDEENAEKAQQELERFQNENLHVLEILPQKYRNYTAALWITDAVSDCRADSLKEAINLYEEQLHRWNMEQLTERLIDQNNQLQDRLQDVYSQLAASNRLLRNIETLEFYNAFIKDN